MTKIQANNNLNRNVAAIVKKAQVEINEALSESRTSKAMAAQPIPPEPAA